MIHFVLQDDASMEQSILNQLMTDGLLLGGERYLGQVVFALMRIGCHGVDGYFRRIRMIHIFSILYVIRVVRAL